jgi:hypothetical protein
MKSTKRIHEELEDGEIVEEVKPKKVRRHKKRRFHGPFPSVQVPDYVRTVGLLTSLV